jgi:hypothetical protein
MKKLLLIPFLVILAGCSAEQYGTSPAVDTAPLPVKDIFLSPSLVGQTVTIEGAIISQCAANGCWFFLEDTTGRILINLAPRGFTMPPRIGKTAKVTGMVAESANGPQVIAIGVKIR